MLRYKIVPGKVGRVVIVQAEDLQRWALHDSNDMPLKWETAGAKAVAITSGMVKLYRKPTGLRFHYDYLLHNSRALREGARFGTVPELETLVRNLYEFIQEI